LFDDEVTSIRLDDTTETTEEVKQEKVAPSKEDEVLAADNVSI
jgi:hypothetical protein